MTEETPTAGAVVYAKDLARVSAFYEQVAGLRPEAPGDGFRRLRAPGFVLVVVAIPPEIAEGIVITAPPERREEGAVKLSLVVASLRAAREAAPAYGGVLDPSTQEWEFDGFRVVDGHDPEGNVVQLRERI